MKVLYLCHRTPFPPDKGEKIRAFHQLAAMAQRHEIDLFTLADEPDGLAHQTELERYCRRVTVARIHPRLARLRSLPYLLTSAPLTVPYFHSAELHTQVRQAMLQRSYDRIFVYCSAMAQYVDPAGGIPTLVDFVDVDSDKWTQYGDHARFPFSAVYRREGRRLREYERRIGETASCVLVTTEREARLAREISPSARVRVVSNGVDTDHFRPPAETSSTAAPAIIFVGDMAYFPNQDAAVYFAKEVLPLIRRTVPDASFLIVGRNPSPDIQALTQIPGVEVTGYVPDVRPFLAKAWVSVAPFSIAAGIQNKILEAMASGVPVVGTPRAIQGLSNGVARLVEAGEDAAQFAEAVVRLLRDPEFGRRRGLEGRRQVTADYSWNAALDYLLQLLEDPTSDDVRRGVPETQVEAELLLSKEKS
jgi:sugar transferase (PEP-CTERM/EpsH1 system associated)